MELRQHCRRDGQTAAWGHRAAHLSFCGLLGLIPDPEGWRDPSRVAEVASLGKGIAALDLEPGLRSRRSSSIDPRPALPPTRDFPKSLSRGMNE